MGNPLIDIYWTGIILSIMNVVTGYVISIKFCKCIHVHLFPIYRRYMCVVHFTDNSILHPSLPTNVFNKENIGYKKTI